MKYQIEVNEIIEAEAGTRDMAIFIARAICNHWENKGMSYSVKVYKDGEEMCTFTK